ncbi:MAG: hypothetical protein QXP70_01495 [Methanomassiliicoccales archaeon]
MAGQEELDYSEITRVYRGEKKSGKPMEIPADFYRKARAYIQHLEERTTDGSGNADATMAALSQIKESRKLLASIWEFRARKLFMLAMAGEEVPPGLSYEEQELYSELLRLLRMARESALTGSQTGQTAEKRGEAENTVETKEGHEEHSTPAESEGKLALIRTNKQVPQFVTEEGSFMLDKEEIAFIPHQYATVLLKRGAAAAVSSSLLDKD